MEREAQGTRRPGVGGMAEVQGHCGDLRNVYDGNRPAEAGRCGYRGRVTKETWEAGVQRGLKVMARRREAAGGRWTARWC